MLQKLLLLIRPTHAFTWEAFRAYVTARFINVGGKMYEKGIDGAGVGGDEDYSELLPSVNRQTGSFS